MNRFLCVLPWFVGLCVLTACTVVDKPAGQTQLQGAPGDAAAGAVFESEVAAAQHFLRPVFSILDCEREDEVEAGEVDEHFHDLFFYVDRDLDKIITEEELIRSVYDSVPAKEQYLFRLMDTNVDARVSALEFRNYIIRAIETADTNRDGMVTLDEL